MSNAGNAPDLWDADIETSVAEYNDWYRAEAPGIYADAKLQAASYVERAFELTSDFTDLSEQVFTSRPDILFAARQALAPPLARDRLEPPRV